MVHGSVLFLRRVASRWPVGDLLRAPGLLVLEITRVSSAVLRLGSQTPPREKTLPETPNRWGRVVCRLERKDPMAVKTHIEVEPGLKVAAQMSAEPSEAEMSFIR